MRTFTTSALVLAATIATPARADDAVILYSGGLDAWLVDEKDRGLREALRMIDERLLELPAELAEPAFPAPVIQIALDLLTGPLQLQAGTIDAAPGVEMPFYVQLTATPGDAGAMVDRLGQLLEMTGAPAVPVEGEPDLKRIDMNGIPLFVGRARGGEMVVAANARQRETALPPTGLPVGIAPNFVIAIDAAAAQPFIQMALAQAGPGAEFIEPTLAQYGITGDVLSSFVAATGLGVDRAYGAWRYTHYATLAERMNALVREPLRRRDMAMVPADATVATLGRANIRGLIDTIRAAGPAMDELPADPVEEIERRTGIHVQRDLLDHFGSSYGFYISDTSGGGGLLSSVFFVEVADAGALQATFDTIASKLNDLARRRARGYVRLAEAVHAGIEMTVLTFPGLPVPLEIAWTITGGYLIAGATPNAVVAAVNQARHGGRSLLANRAFLEMGGDGWSDAVYVSFMDSPRLARSGYAVTSLLCTALANAVRSPLDATRDPGPIMPPLNTLVDGAKASVSVYRWDGDDLVCAIQGDRSQLVNVTAGIGLVTTSGTGLATAALFGGVLLPAIGQAREKARQAVAQSNIRQLVIAMQSYAADHDDVPPPSLQAIWEYLGGPALSSPYGPAADGRGDFWICTSIPRLGQVRFPDRQIAVYDRAMYDNGREQVAVAFFDGHVEIMDTWAFEALLEEAPNAGVDFDLP